MSGERWTKFVDAYARFFEQTRLVVNDENGDAVIRDALVGTEPGPALLLLLTRDFDYRARFLPEILVAVAAGPSSSLLLARDALRSLRRSVLESRIPEEIRSVLIRGDDATYARLAEVIVELRLESALLVLRDVGRERTDPNILDVVRSLGGVETDESRWGRLVVEWPIVDANGRSRK
jgi:hypothetical protein